MKFFKRNTDGTFNNALLLIGKKSFSVHLTERMKHGELVKIKIITSKPMLLPELGRVKDRFLEIGFEQETEGKI